MVCQSSSSMSSNSPDVRKKSKGCSVGRPDSDHYFQQLERKSGLVSLKNEHHQSVVTFIQDRLEEAFPRVPVAVG